MLIIVLITFKVPTSLFKNTFLILFEFCNFIIFKYDVVLCCKFNDVIAGSTKK